MHQTYTSFLKNRNLLIIPNNATTNILIPITTNDVCKPNIADIIPNKITPTISHNFPINSPTHVIVPSSSCLVQSET